VLRSKPLFEPKACSPGRSPHAQLHLQALHLCQVTLARHTPGRLCVLAAVFCYPVSLHLLAGAGRCHLGLLAGFTCWVRHGSLRLDMCL
jgi:hypothetical protein